MLNWSHCLNYLYLSILYRTVEILLLQTLFFDMKVFNLKVAVESNYSNYYFIGLKKFNNVSFDI